MSIKKLEALLAAATPGPWVRDPTGTMIIVPLTQDVGDGSREEYLFTRNRREDAKLIVALVNAAPELLAVVRAAVWDQNLVSNGCDVFDSSGRTGLEDALEALDAKLKEVLG